MIDQMASASPYHGVEFGHRRSDSNLTLKISPVVTLSSEVAFQTCQHKFDNPNNASIGACEATTPFLLPSLHCYR